MVRRASSALAGLPFEPEEVAGEGASAVVWRAREPSSGRAVAVKVARSAVVGVGEAEIVARVARRWGPELVGAGRLASGEVYVATAWEPGDVLAPAEIAPGERARTA